MIELHPELASMSGRQLAVHLIDDLHQTFGLDLGHVFFSASLSPSQKKRRAVALLMDAILGRADDEGYLRDWEAASPDTVAENAFLDQLLGGKVDIEPNVSIVPADLRTIRAYRGNDIKDYLYTLTKRFEQAAKTKSPEQLAIEILSGGVIAVGVPVAVGAIGAYRAGSTLLAAARAGIMGVGMKTAVGLVATILIGLLMFFTIENPKKVLGMVVNDTNEDWTVREWRDGLDGSAKGDLYMAHGRMLSFMLDHTDGLSSPDLQIRRRIAFSDGAPEVFSFGGIYFADKNIGFRGAEGVFALKSAVTGERIAVLFSCPYTKDNGTNMDVIGDASSESVFRRLSDDRKTTMSRSKKGYALQSCVNDSRGGVVGCISVIARA